MYTCTKNELSRVKAFKSWSNKADMQTDVAENIRLSHSWLVKVVKYMNLIHTVWLACMW